MGRSADGRWKKHVLAHLDHLRPAVRAEAASAAGELEIAAARRPLIKLLDDHDTDVRLAAIWALSQVGGEGVRERLERLLERSEDDDEIDLIESALDNLALAEESIGFKLFDVEEADLDDEDALIVEEDDLGDEEDDDLRIYLEDEDEDEEDDDADDEDDLD